MVKQKVDHFQEATLTRNQIRKNTEVVTVDEKEIGTETDMTTDTADLTGEIIAKGIGMTDIRRPCVEDPSQDSGTDTGLPLHEFKAHTADTL